MLFDMKKKVVLFGCGFLSGACVAGFICTSALFISPSEEPAVAQPITVVSPTPAQASVTETRVVAENPETQSLDLDPVFMPEESSPVQLEAVEAEMVVSPLLPEVIAERRARRQEALAKRREVERAAAKVRQDFLVSVDPTFLSEEQNAVHESYTQALALCDEIQNELVERGAEMTSEERIARRRELREAQQLVSEQAESERTLLLEAVARSMGLEGEEPQSFVETVSQVISVTENQGSPRRRPGRRR